MTGRVFNLVGIFVIPVADAGGIKRFSMIGVESLISRAIWVHPWILRAALELAAGLVLSNIAVSGRACATSAGGRPGTAHWGAALAPAAVRGPSAATALGTEFLA